MTEDELSEFGVSPDAPLAEVIPFPRMRTNRRVREAWAEELTRLNAEKKKRHTMPSPLDVVPSLIAKRSMPAMWWPEQWQSLGERCRTYVGECVGVSGSIGGGKTSFALQILIANTGHGHPAIWQALELDPEQVDLRKVANMHGAHMRTVREEWSEERIRHALTATDDMWHFVDHYDDPEENFAALEDAIELAWRVYRVPPVWAVDHLGEMVAEERDDRAALRRWAHRYRKLALRTNSWGILLNQVSKANQAVTTGKVEVDTAADLMGIEMGSQAIASAVSNNIVLIVFKADDQDVLDAHAGVPKARNTGREGKVGMRFRKAGGRWEELDYLPTTPAKVRADQEKERRDKHRVGPPRSTEEIRRDQNAAIASDADAVRRGRMLDAINRHGYIGIEIAELRKVVGVGRGANFQSSLQELLRTCSVERVGSRVRKIGKLE